jgi:hypothetical protein
MSFDWNFAGPNVKVNGAVSPPVQPLGAEVCVRVMLYVPPGIGSPEPVVYQYQNGLDVQPSPECGSAFTFADHSKWKHGEPGSEPPFLFRG